MDFCVQSLEENGYLLIPPQEIATRLKVREEQVEEVLGMLKEQEPHGIFASGLEECLLIRVRGMDQEAILTDMIKHHLQDIRKMIRVIRDKYLRAPSGCFLFRSLFTTGISAGDGSSDVSRNASGCRHAGIEAYRSQVPDGTGDRWGIPEEGRIKTGA